jgi:hypothetical protein
MDYEDVSSKILAKLREVEPQQYEDQFSNEEEKNRSEIGILRERGQQNSARGFNPVPPSEPPQRGVRFKQGSVPNVAFIESNTVCFPESCETPLGMSSCDDEHQRDRWDDGNAEPPQGDFV